MNCSGMGRSLERRACVNQTLCRGGTPLEGSPLCSPISGCVGWEPVGRVGGSPCGREAGASGHTCGPSTRPDRCTCPQSHSAGTQSPEHCTDTAYTTQPHCPTNNSACTRHTDVQQHVVDTGTVRSPDGTSLRAIRYCDTDTLGNSWL